jgi:hypothetical protein
MIFFRRHVIYGPEAGIPPEFERGEIRDVEGSETLKAWHGFLPVWGVEDVLGDALHELERLYEAKLMEPWDDFEVGRIADRIRELLNRLERFEREYEAKLAAERGGVVGTAS